MPSTKTQKALASRMNVRPKKRVRIRSHYHRMAWDSEETPHHPFRDRHRGGLGYITAQSAALFWATLLTRPEQAELLQEFDRAIERRIRKNANRDTYWSLAQHRAHIHDKSCCRKTEVYSWVVRAADRRFGRQLIEDKLLAAAAYGFVLHVPDCQQRSLADYVEQRQAEQEKIDIDARDALVMACSDAAPSS